MLGGLLPSGAGVQQRAVSPTGTTPYDMIKGMPHTIVKTPNDVIALHQSAAYCIRTYIVVYRQPDSRLTGSRRGAEMRRDKYEIRRPADIKVQRRETLYLACIFRYSSMENIFKSLDNSSLEHHSSEPGKLKGPNFTPPA